VEEIPQKALDTGRETRFRFQERKQGTFSSIPEPDCLWLSLSLQRKRNVITEDRVNGRVKRTIHPNQVWEMESVKFYNHATCRIWGFPQRWLWKVSSSGMWRRVVCWDGTDFSEEPIAWRWRRYVPPKRRLHLNRLYGVTSQKMILFMLPIGFRDVIISSFRSVCSYLKRVIRTLIPSLTRGLLSRFQTNTAQINLWMHFRIYKAYKIPGS
jgi:hypothetical protein